MTFENIKINSDRWFELKDLENEIWSEIKLEYSKNDIVIENYLISNYGRIKSYIKCNRHPNIPRILKCSFDKKGYIKYNLIYKEKRIVPFAHRMVAENFVNGKTSIKKEVNHIDGNKKNPRVDNLEWCDYYYNRNHAIKNELINFDLKRIAQIDKQGNIISIYHGYKEASEKTKLPITNIYDRINKKVLKPRDEKYFKEVTEEEENKWKISFT